MQFEAYGLPFASPMVTDSSDWAKRWNTVIHLSGSHYSLPRGPVGHCYVTLLTEEIQHLTQKLCSFERLIVFSSVILQTLRIHWSGVSHCSAMRNMIPLSRKPSNVIIPFNVLDRASPSPTLKSSLDYCYKGRCVPQCAGYLVSLVVVCYV